jgi:hypothetical protein
VLWGTEQRGGEIMTPANEIRLAPALTVQAKAYLQSAMKQHPGIEAVALCALNATVIWASSRSFEKLAPSIGRIGIASLRLWAKTRSGRVERIGIVAKNGAVEIIFVPPLASLLVVSTAAGDTAWTDGEPDGLIAALGLADYPTR